MNFELVQNQIKKHLRKLRNMKQRIHLKINSVREGLYLRFNRFDVINVIYELMSMSTVVLVPMSLARGTWHRSGENVRDPGASRRLAMPIVICNCENVF